jgi:hypothetical protein
MRETDEETCAFFQLGERRRYQKQSRTNCVQCFDPDVPVNIVDLALVYDCPHTMRPEGRLEWMLRPAIYNTAKISCEFFILALTARDTILKSTLSNPSELKNF